MTMYRHKIRYSTLLFERNQDEAPGTLVYYFDVEYITELVTSAGLEIVELEYVTISIQNRKQLYRKSPTGGCMRRVFVHGVFRRPPE